MKKNNIAFLLVFTMAILVSSCKKDNHTDYSTLVKTNPTVNIQGVPASIIVREDTADVIATISVTLSEAQVVDIHIPINQIAGDAELDADYELSASELVFPAFTTGPQEFTVTILDDDIPEADETFTLQIGNETVGNATITPVTMDVTITNSTDLDLNMAFSWSKDYLLHYWSFFDGVVKDTTLNTTSSFPQLGGYPVYDIDVYVFDQDGSAGGNDLGIYDAATGNHPERLTLTAPDQVGTYVMSAALYVNFFKAIGYGSVLMTQGPIPITTSFSRKGVLSPTTLVQSDVESFTTDTEDQLNDGASEFRDLFKVDVQPNMFIIYNIDGSEFVTARKKSPKILYNKQTNYPKLHK